MPEILFIISLLFLTGYVLLLLWYRMILGQKDEFKAEVSATPCFISVIIPARNEEKNIDRCLQSLKKQEYPSDRFEIIVIDDHSEDETANIVSSFPAANIRLVKLKDHISESLNSYKKKALETGITLARGELIVTTDADCVAGKKWLSTINAYFVREKPAFIVMPVAISGEKGFADVFESLDFMSMQGIAIASVEKDKLNLCNGANLAYTKEAFRSVGGFKEIDKRASGDDMLLMEKIRMHGLKIGYLYSKDVIVHTFPAESIGAFLRQRIRWGNKTASYKDKRTILIWGWIYLLNLMLLITIIYALFQPEPVYFFCGNITMICFAVSALAIKTITELIFLFPIAAFFGKRSQLFYFPLAQPFHILYIVLIGFSGLSRKYEWKGRKVR
jgi:cellulose synthase/poly-beta-1,6-N-acetylglucosamine synthase-like glycosyltransferase